MNNIRSMNKSQLLLPLMAISIALMAFAFWAANNNKVEAQNSGYMGIMNEDLILVESSEAGGAGVYTTILSGEVRTPQWEDTVLGVSLECGIYTDTKVKSKGGKSDTSTASARVQKGLGGRRRVGARRGAVLRADPDSHGQVRRISGPGFLH